ncbi:Rrf2 family transcriptional regulator [Magnetovibrio sp. PR-2]|uniref:RrF2 family transcriptional regulator n=1 Tax=Magnetovibrio sp. PR-2 TaxID=3120356 RepID=UPI002FCDEC86
MQLTSYTDFSLRALLYIADQPGRLVTVTEISEHYGVSRNHMVKVVHNLGANGYIKTVRGKSGGVRLAKAPEDISIAAVVKLTEPHMNIQECFDPETSKCPLMGDCRLTGVFAEARKSFMNVLDSYTLADMMVKRVKAQAS